MRSLNSVVQMKKRCLRTFFLFRTHQWVIRPFLLQFQFALQSVDSSSDMVAKAPEADVLGTHFIWSTKDVVCATVTPTLITTFLTLHKYWTSRSALHELMNTFRCLVCLRCTFVLRRTDFLFVFALETFTGISAKRNSVSYQSIRYQQTLGIVSPLHTRSSRTSAASVSSK